MNTEPASPAATERPWALVIGALIMLIATLAAIWVLL